MGNLFNYDNKIFQGLNKIIDCICISALWVLFCIPIFTIGASTTAMYYTVHKVLRNQRSYVFSSFWGAFKENFKQSTIIWLILFAADLLLAMNAYIMMQYLKNGAGALGFLYYLYLVMLVMIGIWSLYLFSYLARFHNTVRFIFKNTAIIAVLNLHYSFLFLVMMVIAVLAVYLIPILILLIPAVLFWLINFNMEKIFRKYMTEDDLKKEIEQDMESKRDM